MAAPWTLSRLCGGLVYPLSAGKHMVGRSQDQNLVISNPCVSRRHCIITVDASGLITIEDNQTANGTYVGNKKIPALKPYPLTDGDIIGFGCTHGVGANVICLDDIVFKLVDCNESAREVPINMRLKFVDEVGLVSEPEVNEVNEVPENSRHEYSDVVDLVSDSELESELPIKTEVRQEMELSNENLNIKSEEQFDEGQQFSIKEEYNVEEEIESLSDSEDEIWAIRLSQSSPGRPLRHSQLHVEKMSDHEETSVSPNLWQPTATNFNTTDIVDAPNSFNYNIEPLVPLEDEDEVYSDDLIKIPDIKEQIVALHQSKTEDDFPHRNLLSKINKEEDNQDVEASTSKDGKLNMERKKGEAHENTLKRRMCIEISAKPAKRRRRPPKRSPLKVSYREDRNRRLKEIAQKEKAERPVAVTNTNSTRHPTVKAKVNNCSRGTFLMESGNSPKPCVHSKRKKRLSSDKSNTIEDHQSKDLSKNAPVSKLKDKEHSPSRSDKDKKNVQKSRSKSKDARNNDQSKVAKRSESLCLTETDQESGPAKRDKHEKRENRRGKDRHNSSGEESSSTKNKNHSVTDKRGEKDETGSSLKSAYVKSNENKTDSETKRIPLKDVPFSNISSDKPVLEVSKKHDNSKKTVQFSTAPCEVKVFVIEPGNKMKKTSELKHTQMHSLPPRSFEQQFLAHMLRWSTKWLEEQMTIQKPPPILPYNNEPMSMCHAFKSCGQYARIIGDLLLMEVWESVTQSYMKHRDKPYKLKMQLNNPPLVHESQIVASTLPTSLTVDLSLPKTETPPRAGELMLVKFAPEEKPSELVLFRHPFYVHSVRVLPARPNNINQFLSLSLQTLNTGLLRHLRQGSPLQGKPLAFVRNELVLMNAIEELRWSPLAPLLLNPEPQHFQKIDCGNVQRCRWTMNMNSSQLQAVESSVSAALGTQPSVQMIQGPPGTGKSSVICAMVMRYLYCDERRLPNRGKVLICAASNAAVDELVVRLLRIRQQLPSDAEDTRQRQRFGMVRVGREESMHPRALDVSLGRLAEKLLRTQRAAKPPPPHREQSVGEINWLEGKLNAISNQLQMERSKGSAAVPALEKRYADYVKRIEQFRSGCYTMGEREPSWEERAEAERRVVEGSDIVVTTLASIANNKLKCLKGRIAMCIVDEAGQAIEPETLIPLTLQVTKLTLIGDPHQLPGFINSQRAKKHGLGESLFARLAATSEEWEESPVRLLDAQYRMHPAIADYPNRAFYCGRVRDCTPSRAALPFPAYRLVFIDSSQERGATLSNETEAWAVSRLVAELLPIVQSRRLDFAVITPYNAQKDLIKRCLFTLIDKASSGVEVNTVDSFQGQERDVVVVSLARSHGAGFLTDPGRVNVMLTRARQCLLVCLNPHALQGNSQWRSLIEDARARSTFVQLPALACRPVTAEAARAQPVLHYLHN